MTGAADIGWTILPPPMSRTSVVELPFGYETGEEGAVTLWRLYDKGLITDDFKGAKLLGITSWPGVIIAGRKSLQKLEDLKGQKIAVGSRRRGEIVAALGGVPVSVPTDETYNALDKGVVDGVMTSHTATRQFKLHEVAKNWTNTPLSGSTAFLFMSKQRYDGLPAAARASIDKHAGEGFSRALGKSNDAELKRALAFMTEQTAAGKVNAVKDIPDAELPKWKNAVRNIYADFDKSVPNGQAIREAYFKTLGDVRAGK
jgi:TRAP-type C4-dicarboxylate transport system substrate-binding protein